MSGSHTGAGSAIGTQNVAYNKSNRCSFIFSLPNVYILHNCLHPSIVVSTAPRGYGSCYYSQGHRNTLHQGCSLRPRSIESLGRVHDRPEVVPIPSGRWVVLYPDRVARGAVGLSQRTAAVHGHVA